MSVSATLCVSIIAIDKEASKVLLVEEQQDGKAVINVPSGHIEPGETPRDAAFRELKEETGYTVDNLEFVGVTELLAPNGKLYLTFVYGTTFNSRYFNQETIEDSEILKSFWVDYREVNDYQSSWRNPLVYKKVEMAGYYFQAKESPFFAHQLPFVRDQKYFKQL